MKKIICGILAILITSFAMQTTAGFDVKVVDGDSLEIKNKRIRLVGIDAPEYFQECYDANGKAYACGKEAKNHLEKLIKNGVRQGEKVKCYQESTDRYKRDLSICRIKNTELNLEMIKAGYAISYRDERYLLAEKRARQKKKGIWQGKFMRPEIYRAIKREEEKQNN
ncbi:MAG: thermonuclease family protein [Alphaproteobacteria bacterium]|nr:thermonuclease family protein [Alphaproteobacteria bacterium]